MNALRVLALASAAAACTASGGGATTITTAAATASATGRVVAFAIADETLQVDRTGGDDGALVPDGIRDVVFAAEVDGPIVALFVATVDARGQATGGYRADTLTGGQEQPRELGGVHATGRGTSGVAVYEGDRALNAPDGSLLPQGPGRRRLRLYVNDDPVIRAHGVRLYARMADRSIATSKIVYW